MEGEEQVAPVLSRKLVPVIEDHAKRRGVRLHLQRRGNGVHTPLRVRVFGIRYTVLVAVRPSEVLDGAAQRQDVQLLGGNVVPETISLVLTRPKRPGPRVKRQPDGVPKSRADDLSPDPSGA